MSSRAQNIGQRPGSIAQSLCGGSQPRTEQQLDRQMNRHTDRLIHRQTDAHTDGWIDGWNHRDMAKQMVNWHSNSVTAGRLKE